MAETTRFHHAEARRAGQPKPFLRVVPDTVADAAHEDAMPNWAHWR
jgi:hypothetical protein